MILNSAIINEKAENFRSHLTESEARIAEGMLGGQPFEEISTELGISREELEESCNKGIVNTYYWVLVALCNTREAESYRKAYDDLGQSPADRAYTVPQASGSKTVH